MTQRRARQEVNFGEGDECIICMNGHANVALLPCRHFVCSECLPKIASLAQFLTNLNGKNCPLCRGPLSGFQKYTPAEIRELQRQHAEQQSQQSQSQSSSQPTLLSQPSLSQSTVVATSSTPVKNIRTDGVWCSKHEGKCKCAVVLSNSGENKNRPYFQCSSQKNVAGQRNCYFVIWACKVGENHLPHQPTCHCNEHCVVRVSTTEKNPGRVFYGCPRGKCGVFAWAGGPVNNSPLASPVASPFRR